MKIYFTIMLMSSILFSNGSIASGYLTPLSSGVKINRYMIHGAGGMTLWVTGINNPDLCGDTSKVHLKGDLSGHKSMVAAAIAAYTSNKRIGLWSTGCSVIPFWGGTTTRPIIHTLWVLE